MSQTQRWFLSFYEGLVLIMLMSVQVHIFLISLFELFDDIKRGWDVMIDSCPEWSSHYKGPVSPCTLWINVWDEELFPSEKTTGESIRSLRTVSRRIIILCTNVSKTDTFKLVNNQVKLIISINLANITIWVQCNVYFTLSSKNYLALKLMQK